MFYKKIIVIFILLLTAASCGANTNESECETTAILYSNTGIIIENYGIIKSYTYHETYITITLINRTQKTIVGSIKNGCILIITTKPRTTGN